MTVTFQLLDTFPVFLELWPRLQAQSLEAQIEGWARLYGARWPELLAKQVDDYSREGLDWREIARERVFPALEARLPAMQVAHAALLEAWEPICAQAEERLGLELDVRGVIYVGLECGAGWVTSYAGAPAVLFGLEAIAACGWSAREAIEGLIAHELGHVAHAAWRGDAAKPEPATPWRQLYEEGFAQRCEHLILGRETWHEAAGTADWLAWCRQNQGRLAAAFLDDVERGESTRRFFGSWYAVEGRAQVGYYLGHEAIRALETAGMELREIARSEAPEALLRGVMEGLAG